MKPPHNVCLKCGVLINDNANPDTCLYCGGTEFGYLGYEGEYPEVDVKRARMIANLSKLKDIKPLKNKNNSKMQ